MEKLRRGIHSLGGNSELRNLIGEEEDVVKAYDNIVKQKNESCAFLLKWANSKGEEHYKNVASNIKEHNIKHAQIYKDLSAEYRSYIQNLKLVLGKQEKLATMEKKVQDLEKQLKKKKGNPATLEQAKSDRDNLSQEVSTFTEETVFKSLRDLTAAYSTFYQSGLQFASEQMALLPGGVTAPQQPQVPQEMVPQQPQVPPEQGFGQPPSGYQQPQFQQPPSGDQGQQQPPTGFQQEQQQPPPGYQPEQGQSQQPPPSGYQQPQQFQQPPPGYQQEQQQPPPGYQQGQGQQQQFQQPPTGYQGQSQPPPPGYQQQQFQQPPPGYQQEQGQFQQPPPNYSQPQSPPDSTVQDAPPDPC